MKYSIFDKDVLQHHKTIKKNVLLCVLSVVFLIIVNLVLLFIRNEIGKVLSFTLNVLLDIIVLTLVCLFYDFKISNDRKILKLFEHKLFSFEGVIVNKSEDTLIYNKIQCHVVTISGKRYYSPVQSKIVFIENKTASITTSKEIILEVVYE